MSFLIRELLKAGLLHDIPTQDGGTLAGYVREPFLENGKLIWKDGPTDSLDEDVLRPVANPFAPTGGLTVLDGNLGRGVIKVSAVKEAHRLVEAPVKLFSDQDELKAAFEAGELEQDMVAVVRYQGPRANGMPELHKLTPYLGILQDRGFKVALVTDGRMSGASGKIPAAIHVCPEAFDGGPLARVRDGDLLRVDGQSGKLLLLGDEVEFASRELAPTPPPASGCGRELFAFMRHNFSTAEQGASAFTESLESLV